MINVQLFGSPGSDRAERFCARQLWLQPGAIQESLYHQGLRPALRQLGLPLIREFEEPAFLVWQPKHGRIDVVRHDAFGVFLRLVDPWSCGIVMDMVQTSAMAYRLLMTFPQALSMSIPAAPALSCHPNPFKQTLTSTKLPPPACFHLQFRDKSENPARTTRSAGHGWPQRWRNHLSPVYLIPRNIPAGKVLLSI